jgi:hypothetical protein
MCILGGMTAGIILHALLPTVPRSAPWRDSLLQALPYAHRLRLTSRTETERAASLGGLALALLAAERIRGQPVAAAEFVFPAEGKPRFRSGPCFSVSHTATRVAVVASASLDVGLDLEDIPAAADEDMRQKLQRWTATEALLKVRGRGLRAVGEVAVDDSLALGSVRTERFALQPVAAIHGVMGCLAASAQADWLVEECDLDGALLSAALERSLGLPSQFD